MVKFLVVRFSSIGDIILTTPVVRHLKKQVNDAEVHFLTKETFASLLEANPYIDRIFTIENEVSEITPELRMENYERIIDLHKNLRSKRIILNFCA